MEVDKDSVAVGDEIATSVTDAESSAVVSNAGLPLNQLRCDLLTYLSLNDKAHFKSQQKDDPELSKEHKRKIAEDLLDRSPAQFLGRFGHYLLEEHLKYFSEDSRMKNESYEIGFHLRRLQRFYCKATNNVDVKNRRYDAMKKMIAGGSTYFSEDEMRQRNPYLYEQLVGQYLSEEERAERETTDLQNISFVNLLLMKISKDETKELKKQQEKEECGNLDGSSTDEDESDRDMLNDKSWNERGTWGETTEDIKNLMNNRRKKKKKRIKDETVEAVSEISDEERLLLMQEFVSTMYQSFIDGNDADFDYSQVDSNPDYDCIDVRERDEEEKYFDAETPEDEDMELADPAPDPMPEGAGTLPLPPSMSEKRKAQEKEEDTLDAFMKTIEEPLQTSQLAAAFQNLCHQNKFQRPEKSKVVKKSHVIKINLKKE